MNWRPRGSACRCCVRERWRGISGRTRLRLRPARFGGPEPDPQIGMEPKRSPMSGDEVGRLLLRAIRADQFWVFTHPQNRALVEAGHAEVMAGFDFLGADGRDGAG